MAEKTTKKETISEEVQEIVENIEDSVSKATKKVKEVIEEAVESIGKKSKKTSKLTKSANVKSNEGLSDETQIKAEKLAKLKAKAAKLAEAVEEKEIDITKVKTKKSKDSDFVEKSDALVPIEDYLKSSIHLGTRVITPDMKPFVYKRRADGLAVFNTALLDDMIREGADFLSQFAPEDIIIVGKREAGWQAINLFSKITGIRAFTKKYPAGILTNPQLDNFIETELVLICDPWIDKNALNDANRVGVPVLSICDTNNYTKGISKIISGNNKSGKSVGMILYLLAKLYVEKRKLKVEIPDISMWVENWDTLVPPK